jgi:tetratricopeptide (TPR) repeat protein
MVFFTRLVACIIFYYVCVFLHELGHLCAARLVGWKPLALTMGSRRARTLFRIGDVRFNLGSFSFGGRAHAYPLSSSLFRLKRVMHIAGGPAVSILIAACLWLLLRNDALMDRTSEWWQGTIGSFLVIDGYLCAITLIPYESRSGGHRQPNDMAMIIGTLSMNEGQLKTEFATGLYFLVNFLAEEGRLGEAEAILQNNTGNADEELMARGLRIRFLLKSDKNLEAQDEINSLISSGIPSTTAVEVLDLIACIPVFYGHPEMLDVSMRCIDVAIQKAPDMITLKGTKGSLLIDQGSIDEGIEMLEEVRNSSNAPLDKAISTYFLALAFFKKGEKEKCNDLLKSAIALDPQCVVRWRIEESILGIKQPRGKGFPIPF